MQALEQIQKDLEQESKKKAAAARKPIRANPDDGFLAGLLTGLATLSPQPTKP